MNIHHTKRFNIYISKNCLFFILILFPTTLFSQNNKNKIFEDSKVQISEIGTNTKLSDFGPDIVQDSLYFTTFSDNLSDKTTPKGKKVDFYKLFKVAVDKEGNPTGRRMQVDPFITQFNEGPVSYCDKTGELFITANYIDNSLSSKKFKYKINRLRIVIAKKKNGQWIQIEEFPFNNKDYSVGHPAITQSGDTLILSSDKPGGFGETDLYYSVRKNGAWQAPINLGSKINTSGKEEFPSLTSQPNGQFLIFSSKGHSGFGDFDLYYTRFPGDFNEIGHFETPVNTAFADFAMTIPGNSEYGYLTSNRPGSGDDDIYKFIFRQTIKPPSKRTLYAIDNTSKRPIAEVLIVDQKNIKYVTDRQGKVTNFPCDGDPSEITAGTFGYQEKTLTLPGCGESRNGISIDTIWMEIAVNKKITLKNIYFDFDKWDILPESARSLDLLVSLMKENPEIKVILSSHTDDRGTEIYNLKLSQSRAQSSVNYVISQGIEKSRITGIGYGKTQLIHKNLPGFKITPEQNRENRRTEIFIPGLIQSESVKQQDGDFVKDRAFTPSKNYTPGPEPVKNTEKVSSQVNGIQKFYVIVGSFKDSKVASALAKKLRLKGVKPTIIHEIEQFRVGIEYPDYDHATEAKKNFQKTYKSAWVLVQEN